MGLDMYLEAEVYLSGLWQHVRNADNDKARAEVAATNAVIEASGLTPLYEDGGGVEVKCVVAYWRKANQIHNWFVTHCQDGVDNCLPHYVEREQLAQLRELCNTILQGWNKDGQPMEEMRAVIEEELPPTEGFFFGSTGVDEWYRKDLESTIRQIDKVLEVYPEDPEKGQHYVSLYYRSSW